MTGSRLAEAARRRLGAGHRWENMRGWTQIGTLVALLLAVPCTGAVPQGGIGSKQCLECHGVAGETPAAGKTDRVSIYVGDWEKGVHAGLECTDCHAGISSLPHDSPLPRPDCSACHPEQVETYAKGTHAAHAAAGDRLAPRCASCHDPHTVRPSSDPQSVLYRSNLTQVCIRCHADGKTVGARQFAVPHPAQSYTQGAHEQAMRAGKLEAATCSDCHDSHAALRAQDPTSPIFRHRVPETCGKCHQDIYREYAASVHGRGVARGGTDAPVCTTCHGEHAVATFGEHGKTTIVASETCESCHSNPTLARRYDLPLGAVSSYEDSYHGRAARGGLSQVAGCTSCHGVHRILPKSNPGSSINPANLVATCSACHAGSTLSFATSYAHAPERRSQNDRAAATVRGIYRWVIWLVIGGMALHNLVVWRHDLLRTFRAHRARAVHVRFTRGEVRQHAALLVSFLTLVVTGFALRYPDALWARALAAIGLGEDVRRIVHRSAAVVMVAAALYHVFYLFTRRGREQLRHMVPTADDARQAVANMLYQLGRTSRPPEFGRFRYIEKAEYWALVWGTGVMVGTGLILWFPETLGRPSWLVRVSEAVHLYEAWLAFLAIVVWHLFFVLFRPGIQGALTAVTGKMDPEELAHEHPGEYARTYGDRPSRAKILAASESEARASGSGPEVAG